MRIHILGICGTFMGGIALLAREAGHEVSGSDQNIYPPMSDMLAAHRICPRQGYHPRHLRPAPDLVIVGNALARSNPLVEYLLEEGIPHVSGPEWLAREILPGRRLLAVAGTHGKTSTSSMLAWILERAGLRPGYLVGGLPGNFDVSARRGGGDCFVVEADEYHSAFFDRRPKFMLWRYETLVLTNLEYDHADIFPDLESICAEFSRLLKLLRPSSLLLYNSGDAQLRRLLERGCWSRTQGFGGPGVRWRGEPLSADATHFRVYDGSRVAGEVRWEVLGRHNLLNALAAIAAAREAGVSPGDACAALGEYRPVRRRLQFLGRPGGISLYDDFAHHPTEIRCGLQALRPTLAAGARLFALTEPRTHSMRMGAHQATLAPALVEADRVLMLHPATLSWDLAKAVAPLGKRCTLCRDGKEILALVLNEARPGDVLVIMSNGDFADLRGRLLELLETRGKVAAPAHESSSKPGA